ncbi:hypothetical protein R1sor_015768 [Riccia sorocarpa]|uniref:tRNA:m(4)X modification enzyme TRM13 n=1 Tax=Riccia sorocarpa TaxID=122646 RepID=A0ABD3HG82_9MARC
MGVREISKYTSKFRFKRGGFDIGGEAAEQVSGIGGEAHQEASPNELSLWSLYGEVTISVDYAVTGYGGVLAGHWRVKLQDFMAQKESEEKQDSLQKSSGSRILNGEVSNGHDRCGLWLPSKRRFCASYAVKGSLYCGNHDPAAGKNRVPCPVDPSHTVLREDVALHVKKCQATKNSQAAEAQPYYCKGGNAGSDEEEEEKPHTRSKPASAVSQICLQNGDHDEPVERSPENEDVVAPEVAEKREKGSKFWSSAAKRAAISALSEAEFQDLVKRIETSYEVCTRKEPVEESFLRPPQCLQWWDYNRDRRLPFQEKHVSQQASMLGNLEAFRLLQGNQDRVMKLGTNRDESVYVEFGAGRGYLSQMLCDSYGVSSVVLVERKAYKYKADRTLRQLTGVSVERLRTDIEDLRINGVPSLQGRSYVAVSKHLCGPATDMTLRCCLSAQEEGRSSSPALEGLGIATCCHHLCQWRSYVNKQFFRDLGFSEAEFNMITWLTSWAVNGSEEHAEHQELGPCTEKISSTEESSHKTQKYRPRLSEAMHTMEVSVRAEVGRRCKHLIDHGRLLFLKRHGLEGKLVKYISASVSPENKLLLARRNRS